MPYYVATGKDWRQVHEGPAMLAGIIGPDGRFSGVHITWLDLSTPKGKAELFDPVTGEVLPAKKVRGSAGGGRIELLRSPGAPCLIIGEGIETVLSVYTALLETGRSLDGIAMWSAISLGNLAGAAARDSRERHPTATDKAGRAQRVPGRCRTSTARPFRFPTMCATCGCWATATATLSRRGSPWSGRRRGHAAPGRRVSIAWPEPGRDFNSMVA